MKRIALFAMLALFASAAFAQEFTFQGLPWGSTKEQVIAKLGQPTRDKPVQPMAIITYENVLVDGINADLHISFYNKGMIEVVYDFQPTLPTYISLQSSLSKKYGKPSLFKQGGDISFALWNKKDFHVLIFLEARNDNLTITYNSDYIYNSPDKQEELEFLKKEAQKVLEL